VNRDEATTLLSEFVDLHQKALTYPLPFLPELSGQWFESIEKNEAEAARTKKIVTAWNQDMAGSEGKNPYYTRLFNFPEDLNAEFDQLAQKIYQPLLSNWEKIK
jgi:exonuclease V gamma subunit